MSCASQGSPKMSSVSQWSSKTNCVGQRLPMWLQVLLGGAREVLRGSRVAQKVPRSKYAQNDLCECRITSEELYWSTVTQWELLRSPGT